MNYCYCYWIQISPMKRPLTFEHSDYCFKNIIILYKCMYFLRLKHHRWPLVISLMKLCNSLFEYTDNNDTNYYSASCLACSNSQTKFSKVIFTCNRISALYIENKNLEKSLLIRMLNLLVMSLYSQMDWAVEDVKGWISSEY